MFIFRFFTPRTFFCSRVRRDQGHTGVIVGLREKIWSIDVAPFDDTKYEARGNMVEETPGHARTGQVRSTLFWVVMSGWVETGDGLANFAGDQRGLRMACNERAAEWLTLNCVQKEVGHFGTSLPSETRLLIPGTSLLAIFSSGLVGAADDGVDFGTNDGSTSPWRWSLVLFDDGAAVLVTVMISFWYPGLLLSTLTLRMSQLCAVSSSSTS